MSLSRDVQKIQFRSTVTSMLNSAEEEYDLDAFDICHCAVEALNEWMDTPILDFTPDWEEFDSDEPPPDNTID
tara:strand:+ start:260 stop:478 length:219 start_codon:yes stop_codon:yes gene_type:complete